MGQREVLTVHAFFRPVMLNIKACAMEVVVNRSDLIRVYPSCMGQVRTDK